MLYEVFDGNVFDEIFGTSTYYPVLQQALFHCAARTDIQNFFLAWAPSNMGVLRTVVGDAYLMYLVYNAYPSFFTSQVMDNFGVEEFYRAFERMTNFNISDLMALLQNSMDPGRYDDFAASVPSFLSYEEKISLTEHYIYGSQRLGAKKATKQLQSHTLQYESGNWLPQEVNYMAEPVPAYVAKAAGLVDVGYGLGTWLANGKLKYPQEATYMRKLGFKEYELTNHLGNVQATVLDRRLGIKANPSDTIFSYVEADVKTAQDYYPFGMMMPGRSYNVSATLPYRYGFNGKESDNEVYGSGNSYDFGARMYDPRIGRFLSIDPRWREFPFWAPYAYAGNNPVRFVDVNGEGPGDGPFTRRATVNAGSVQIFRITTSQRVVMNTAFATATVFSPGGTAMALFAESYKFAANPGIASAGSLGLTVIQEGALFAADKITAHGMKDVIAAARQETIATLNKGVKASGKALGGLNILMNAIDTDPTRQETLEKMSFELAGKMFGDVNIVNDGLFKFDPNSTLSPEMAERSMNRIFYSLDTLLPEGQYDLTAQDGINAAYDVIGANLNSLVRDIQKNIPLTRDTDE